MGVRAIQGRCEGGHGRNVLAVAPFLAVSQRTPRRRAEIAAPRTPRRLRRLAAAVGRRCPAVDTEPDIARSRWYRNPAECTQSSAAICRWSWKNTDGCAHRRAAHLCRSSSPLLFRPLRSRSNPSPSHRRCGCRGQNAPMKAPRVGTMLVDAPGLNCRGEADRGIRSIFERLLTVAD